MDISHACSIREKQTNFGKVKYILNDLTITPRLKELLGLFYQNFVTEDNAIIDQTPAVNQWGRLHTFLPDIVVSNVNFQIFQFYVCWIAKALYWSENAFP